MAKLSLYNFFIEDKGKHICFNGISRFVFALNEKEYDFLKSSLENLSNFEEKYPSYYELLKKKCFIIDDDLNEYDYIRFINRLDVFSNNRYRIIINPTLECNFRCWYCYEKHPKGMMTKELSQRIIKHIAYVANNKQVQKLDLTWFGGEPLLYFNDVVYPISKAAKTVFKENGLDFSNHATTNAYLINQKMIDRFNEIDLCSFQITVDGMREEHDQIRNEKGKPSFDKIMENIKLICASNKEMHVLLRINYTDKTLENMESIFDEIPENFKNQISIGFHRVWQTLGENKSEEDKQKIIAIIDTAIQKGFMCSSPDTFTSECIRCYADRFWHTEINYNGDVYKCTMDYSKKPHGKLQENGMIEWDKSYMTLMYSQATFENEMCKTCKLLPICFGPCTRKMAEAKQYNLSLANMCNMGSSEIGYDNLILNHYKYLLKQHKS
jgi:uncharacterized protein